MLFNGYLDIDNYNCLSIKSEPDEYPEYYLLAQIDNYFKNGDNVYVRYFISDKECSLDEAVESLVLKSIGGKIDDLEFVLEAYSEYTILEYRESFLIGGHDLFKELQSFTGKYINLIIEKVE